MPEWKDMNLKKIQDKKNQYQNQKKKDLVSLCKSRNVRGKLILATEGINGNISGKRRHISAVIQHISNWPEIESLDVKYSWSTDQNFNRMKVKIKKEIVTKKLYSMI